MAERDELEDLLDSALDDFRIADAEKPSASRASEKASVSNVSHEPPMIAAQGLGLGLPALGSRGRRGPSAKAKSSGKIPTNTKTDERASNSGRLTDTLEELAQQTRQTLEGLETNDQDTMTDKLIESIAKQFEELSSSEDMQSVMDSIMQQLLSKEVLHEPMKEFSDKYPKWLEANKSSLNEEDFSRYSRQYEYIKELCSIYESTPDDFSKVVDIMHKMQGCGQPPDDLVQELGPGKDFKGDGLPFLADLFKEGDQSGGANQNCSLM